MKFVLKTSALFLTLTFIHPILSSDSVAHARKRTPPKAYTFITEGGKASQGECDGERKIPRGLKRLPDFRSSGSYMGSELQSPEIKGKIDGEMWKHLFRDKGVCNTILAKTPSAIEETKTSSKQELPPEENDDSETESESSERSDAE
ncbi:hypothetical protein BDW_09650 [Bdellovibrio bacteriovorus W]|nr:hypothetical protein BDW_09650 [Bdellovibrio bacteriovorus W]